MGAKRLANALSRPKPLLWGWVTILVVYVGADVVTTLFGLYVSGVSEANPFVAPVVGDVGLAGRALFIVSLKLVAVGWVYLVYRWAPRWSRGILVWAIASVGVGILVNNVAVIAIALGVL